MKVLRAWWGRRFRLPSLLPRAARIKGPYRRSRSALMKRIVTALGKLNWGAGVAVLALCAATSMALPAQTPTTLHTFCQGGGQVCRDGVNPPVALVQSTNGEFYGTTAATVFKITPSGTLTTIHDLCSDCADGIISNATLIQATNGISTGQRHSGGRAARAPSSKSRRAAR